MITERVAFLKAKNEVMKLVGYVQKEKVKDLRYTIATERALIEALRPAMVEAGLMIAPTDMEILYKESQPRVNGGSMHQVIVKVIYQLSHIAGGSETITTIGEGMDVGDKATNKAMTIAMKYALRQAFLIETGDDPDETPSERFVELKQAQEQRAQPHQNQYPPQPQQPQHMPAATQYDPKMYHTCGKLIQAAVSEQQLQAAGQMVKQNDAKLHPDDLKDLQRAYRQKQTAIRNAAGNGNEYSGTDVF